MNDVLDDQIMHNEEELKLHIAAGVSSSNSVKVKKRNSEDDSSFYSSEYKSA